MVPHPHIQTYKTLNSTGDNILLRINAAQLVEVFARRPNVAGMNLADPYLNFTPPSRGHVTASGMSVCHPTIGPTITTYIPPSNHIAPLVSLELAQRKSNILRNIPFLLTVHLHADWASQLKFSQNLAIWEIDQNAISPLYNISFSNHSPHRN